MNRHSDIDRVLSRWFEDGPSMMPDRIVGVVAERIGRQPQRRAWHPRGRPYVNRNLKLALGLAAAAIVAVVAWQLLPGRGGGIGGPATPSPSPTATSIPFDCEGNSTSCAGWLAPGEHTSAHFQPAVSYVVPEFWANSYDAAHAYSFYPAGGAYSFQLLSTVRIPEQTPDCTAKFKAGSGNTVADWVDFLTTHAGLDAEAPHAVTIGGYEGFSVRFSRAASWTQLCPNSVGAAVVTIAYTGPSGLGNLWVDDQQVTYWILDVGGNTVIIHLDSSPNPDDHVRDLGRAQPVIDSFRFTP